MKPKTEAKPEKKSASPSANGSSGAPAKPQSKSPWSSGPVAVHRHNEHGIPDYRVEVLKSHTFEVIEKDGHVHYEVEGVDAAAPAPALCKSKYLDKAKS